MQTLIHHPTSTHYGKMEAKSACGVWFPWKPKHRQEPAYISHFSTSLKFITCPTCLKFRIDWVERELNAAKGRLNDLSISGA